MGATVEITRVTADARSSRSPRPLWPTAALLLALLPFAVVLIVAFAVCFQSRLTADDWVAPGLAAHGGIPAVFRWFWSHWSGRYSWIALLAIQAAWLPTKTAGLVCPLCLLALSLSAWRLFAVLSGSKWLSLAPAVACIASLYWLLPQPQAGIFWNCAALNYLTSLAAAIWLLAETISRPRPSLYRGAALVVLAFFGAGLNEMTTAAMIAILGCIGAAQAVRRSPLRAAAAVLAGYTLGMAVMALAPGNRARYASEGARAHPALVSAAVTSVGSAVSFATNPAETGGIIQFSDPLDPPAIDWPLAAALLGPFLLGYLIAAPRNRPARGLVILLCSLAAGFLAILVSFFVFEYAAGHAMAPRSLTIPGFVEIFAISAAGVAMRSLTARPRLVAAAGVACVALSVVFLVSSYSADMAQLRQAAAAARTFDATIVRGATVRPGASDTAWWKRPRVQPWSSHDAMELAALHGRRAALKRVFRLQVPLDVAPVRCRQD